MTNAIRYIFQFMHNIISLLRSYTFDFYNVHVSIIDIIFAFIVISMVVTVFWKGARG